MIQKRYTDPEKLISNIDELELTDAGEVLIYRGDQWYGEVTVNLEGKEEKFEELKPMIADAAKHLWEMDLIAQRYDALYGDGRFAFSYEAVYICLCPFDEMSVRYYGMLENTEFDVVFQCDGDKLLLKRIGMRKNIPLNWDKNQEQTYKGSGKENG